MFPQWNMRVTNRTTHAASISSSHILRQHQTKSHQNPQQRHGTARNTTQGSTFQSEAAQPLKNPRHRLIKLATKKGADVITRPHRHTLARTSKALTHLKEPITPPRISRGGVALNRSAASRRRRGGRISNDRDGLASERRQHPIGQRRRPRRGEARKKP
jgi:hypothetical protein